MLDLYLGIDMTGPTYEPDRENLLSPDAEIKVLTFDVEDWFHLIDAGDYSQTAKWDSFESRLEPMMELILDLLADHQVTATFFVLGWVAERYPALMKSLADAGHSIGCHSHLHIPVTQQTEEKFRADLIEAMAAIEGATGIAPKAYRAPGFSITRQSLWAFDILAEEGIEIDCSIFLGSHAHGGLRGLKLNKPFRLETLAGHNLKCLPMTTVRLPFKQNLCFSGGGYFRLLPPALLAYFFTRENYVMTYFHPRDFDGEQPPIELGVFRTWRAMTGVKSSMSKLDNLLGQHIFEDVMGVSGRLDWRNSPEIAAASLIDSGA